jgi:hypothetical protein
MVVTLGGCGLPDAPRAGGTTDAPLLLAQSRWQARHPAHYRLVVQEDTDDHSCRQAVEVQDEQVESILEDHCGRATPWTVSNLLDWIGEHARTSAVCNPASMICACYIHEVTNAVYDSRLGYPCSNLPRQTGTP